MAPPSIDDLIRVLAAWRLWILAGLLGGLIGASVYIIVPPPHRARATVNVDFHLEQAWPQEVDRQQFYYLERETRKLVEIAYSDATLSSVTAAVEGATIQGLRNGAAQLSQPGNGGWHFFGIDRDATRAAMIATTWATAFSRRVTEQVSLGPEGGLERFITADVTQVSAPLGRRTVSMGLYMLAGAMVVWMLAAMTLLFLHRPA